MTEATRDALFRGAINFWQPAKGRGYRFNMDSVFLADFAMPSAHCVDLGAGCGVVGLLILHVQKSHKLTMVERQPQMTSLCRDNLTENGFAHLAEVVEADLRELPTLSAETVVFNPPYFPAGSGRASPTKGKDEGRFERYGTLSDFIRAAKKIVTPEGTISAILRAERLDEARAIAKEHHLFVRRERLILPRKGDVPRNVLIELTKDSSAEKEVLPHLIIHRGEGRDYTDEVRQIFEEPNSWTRTNS